MSEKEKKKGKQPKREPVYKDELPKLIEDFFAQKQAEREKWEEEQIAKGQLTRLSDPKDKKEAGVRKYDFGRRVQGLRAVGRTR